MPTYIECSQSLIIPAPLIDIKATGSTDVITAEEIEAYYRAILEPFSDLRFEAEIRANDGGTIVGEAVMSGIHSGPLPLPGGESLPPTDRRFSLRLVDVVAVVEGRVARKHVYYDNLDFFRQLGILDADGQA
jgi:predicted ester cyclase